MKLQRFYPLFAAIFVWHLRCVYEASIVSPIWWIYPLPIKPDLRLMKVVGAYGILLFVILYQMGIKENNINYLMPAFTILLFCITLLGCTF